MKEILIASDHHNSSDIKEPQWKELVKVFTEMEEYRKAGKPIYIKILTGDRKGSIGKYITDGKISAEIYNSRDYGEDTWRFESNGIYGRMIWDGRKNNVQCDLWLDWLSNPEKAWLKDYNGPTVYKIFDKKKAKKELIKKNPQKDIDGKKLEIGDKVLYINLAYGMGAQLSRGEVVEFQAVSKENYGDKRSESVYTIVKLDGKDYTTKMEHSKKMILKTT